jgi:DNA-binding PadR family transcriptional regulator
VVVLEQEAQDGKEMNKENYRERPRPNRRRRALGNAQGQGRSGRATRKLLLTTPDLVLLSLLAERPMHGYQANLELERREIRDWAGISRPQVYYSLEKLARAGLICASVTAEPTFGPERNSYETTAKGRAAMAAALERKEWATERERPPFLTWIALSWLARKGVFEMQIRRRQKFLQHELAREKATLRSILEEVGHPYHEAVWMVSHVIEQFRLELRWLGKLKRELPQRAPARHASYASSDTA